jgi:hypothetical protein
VTLLDFKKKTSFKNNTFGQSIAYVGISTKGHLIALRFCLGVVEAGYFVCYPDSFF